MTINTQPTRAEHDTTGEAVAFLRMLFGDAVGSERRLSIFTLPGARSVRFASIEKAVDYAQRQTSLDAYFGVGLIGGDPPGRGKASDVCATCGLWADIDLIAPWRADKPLPVTLEEATTVVDAMPFAPSVIVDSGHGLHGYWVFREPWVFESEEERLTAARIAEGWHALVCDTAAKSGWHLENLGDLARVLRLPGTLNHKGAPVRVRILESYPDRRYNPDDFEPFAVSEDATPAHLPDVLLSASAQPPLEKMIEATTSSPKFRATWDRTRTDLSDTSQSGYDLALASIAARMGWRDQEIADLIFAHRTRHGEDPEKALRGDYIRKTLQKAREGMPAGDEPVNIDGMLRSGETMTHKDQGERAPGEWGDTVPLDAQASPPDIDLDACFAPVPALRDYIAAIAESNQVDPAMPAMLALSCVSLAIARAVEVQLGPDWLQPSPVWTCIIAEPGERKSAVFKELTAPFFIFQKERDEHLHRLLARYAAETRNMQKRIDVLRTRYTKHNDGGDHYQLLELEENLACREDFQKPRLLLMDATPESVIVGLHRNGGRLGIIAAESSALENALGRYSDNPNLDIYLQAHEGDPYSYARRKGDDIVLERPALVMSLCIQPHAARGLLESPASVGRGMFARFLFCNPRSLKGRRKLETEGVPGELRWAWEALILQLLALPYPDEVCRMGDAAARRDCEPRILTLDDDAREAFLVFRRTIERELSPDDGELAHTYGWAEKLAAATGRIALSLQMAKRLDACTIGRDAVDAAIAWSEFLTSAFRHTVTTVGLDPIRAQARRVVGWVRREQLESFTHRDACRRHRCKSFKTNEAWQPVFDLLRRRHYIRPTVESAQGRKGGRPSAGYEVNPQVLSGDVDSDE